VSGPGGTPEGNGGNSRFGNITVYGGASGVWNSSGISGGSGGAGNPGGLALSILKNGSLITQGYSGGNNSLNCGGGGGGYLSSGGNALESSPGSIGVGFSTYDRISGGYVYRAYGGVGACHSSNLDGANALENTGRGGGGGGKEGRPGSGGSGYLMFRFNGIIYNPKIQVIGDGNYVNYTDSYGYVYYEFRGSGSANITFTL
jgi:hypothetical protein